MFFLNYSIPDCLNLLVSWWFYDGVSLWDNADKNSKDRMRLLDFMNGINEPTRILMIVFEKNGCMSHNAN